MVNFYDWTIYNFYNFYQLLNTLIKKYLLLWRCYFFIFFLLIDKGWSRIFLTWVVSSSTHTFPHCRIILINVKTLTVSKDQSCFGGTSSKARAPVVGSVRGEAQGAMGLWGHRASQKSASLCSWPSFLLPPGSLCLALFLCAVQQCCGGVLPMNLC